MPSALILGNYRPSFVLARRLHERGIRVICGLRGYDRGAEVSRYVDAVWDHPSLTDEKEKFQKSLTEFLLKNPDVTLVFPVVEDFVRAFAEDQLHLPDNVQLASMPKDVVLSCLEKDKLLQLASSLNVPLAPFAVTRSYEEMKAKVPEIGFPVVVRPLSSTLRLGGKKALTFHALDELLAAYQTWNVQQTPLLIQKRFAGKRENVYFAAHEGKIFQYLHAKILRTDQPDGSGLALDGKTIEPCPKLQRYTKDIVNGLNYSGVGCAQFLVDEEKDTSSFLEINPRLAGNHALPEACGLTLSDCLIDQTLGLTHDTTPRFGDVGKRYTWLAGDMESAKNARLRGEISLFEMLDRMARAVWNAYRSDLDVGFPKKDKMPGILSLCDSLPYIGRLTRSRFNHGFARRLFIRREIVL